MKEKKMSRLFIIGTLYNDGGELVGLRVLLYDDKDIMDATFESVYERIKDGVPFENAEMIDGRVLITNCNMNRLPKINIRSKRCFGNNQQIVLYRIGELGFVICDYRGKYSVRNTATAVEKSQDCGFVNARVVYDDNGFETIVSATSRDFKELDENISKNIHESNNNTVAGIAITTDSDGRSVNRSIKMQARNAVAQKDVFGCFNNVQTKSIEDYYLWYTRRVFNKLSRSEKLRAMPSKVEKLSQLKGKDTWRYMGVIDMKVQGLGRCELGHPLRFVNFAAPESNTAEQNSRKENWIRFGVTCVSDFFSISPEGMKALIKTQQMMVDEISEITEIKSSGRCEEHNEKFRIIFRVAIDLSNKDKEFNKVGSFIAFKNFLAQDIPVPASVIIDLANEIRKRKNEVYELYCGDIKNIREMLDGNKHSIEFNNMEKAMFDCLIESIYQYNPLNDEYKRKDVGRYNATTRAERHDFESNIRRYITKDQLSDGKEEAFDTWKRYIKAIENIYEASQKVYGFLAQKLYPMLDTDKYQFLINNKFDENGKLVKSNPYLRIRENRINFYPIEVEYIGEGKYKRVQSHPFNVQDEVKTTERWFMQIIFSTIVENYEAAYRIINKEDSSEADKNMASLKIQEAYMLSLMLSYTVQYHSYDMMYGATDTYLGKPVLTRYLPIPYDGKAVFGFEDDTPQVIGLKEFRKNVEDENYLRVLFKVMFDKLDKLNDKIYRLEGYDKDNDVYETYLITDSLDEALDRAKELRKQIENGTLRRKTGTSNEPIDTLQIVHNIHEEKVFWRLSDELEKEEQERKEAESKAESNRVESKTADTAINGNEEDIVGNYISYKKDDVISVSVSSYKGASKAESLCLIASELISKQEEKGNIDSNDYGIVVCKDICRKVKENKVKASDLSKKQIWRLKKTILDICDNIGIEAVNEILQ